jgi:hypothetical protein
MVRSAGPPLSETLLPVENNSGEKKMIETAANLAWQAMAIASAAAYAAGAALCAAHSFFWGTR